MPPMRIGMVSSSPPGCLRLQAARAHARGFSLGTFETPGSPTWEGLTRCDRGNAMRLDFIAGLSGGSKINFSRTIPAQPAPSGEILRRLLVLGDQPIEIEPGRLPVDDPPCPCDHDPVRAMGAAQNKGRERVVST